MDRYDLGQKLGAGEYGIVYKAKDLETGEEVAVKELMERYPSKEECEEQVELILLNLKHPNVIQLKDYVYDERENESLCLIFEYMECNLSQFIRRRRPLCEDTIRDMAAQLLQGLRYIHGKGYFHRDLKPDNLLVQGCLLKIADFGTARDISSRLPLETEVTSLWYRAPEVLLEETYNEKIDMWAVGVIMAELYRSEPLFRGADKEDQLRRIWEAVGVPDDLRDPLEIDRKQIPDLTLRQLIPGATEKARDLIQQLLSWNPTMRPTAFQALSHPFFNTTKDDVYKHPTSKRHRRSKKDDVYKHPTSKRHRRSKIAA